MKKTDTWIKETRAEAFAARRTKYWTGEPCVRGHWSQRYTKSGVCVECCNRPRSAKKPDDTVVLVETRETARAAGRPKYYPGEPCIRGHKAPRYTNSGICTKCNYENTKAYHQRKMGINDGKTTINIKINRNQVPALKQYANLLNEGV